MIGPFDLIDQSAHSAVLYTARPDGSGMRRLSQRGIDGVYEDYHARFAASGKYLIFVRVRNRDLKTAVFRMRPDGSGRGNYPRRLDADIPDLSLAARWPAKDQWSSRPSACPPKGSQQDIATPGHLPPAGGVHPRDPLRHAQRRRPRTSFNPSWSPGGKRIAFTDVLFPAGKPRFGDIWTVRPDGRGRQQVSHSP